MKDVPFLYVNLTALCCFVLIFITFLAAKKTKEIRAFIFMLLGFILWTGGSILMRLQRFPGVDFWYYVSIMAFFSLADVAYFFVCSYMHKRGSFLKIVWTVGTVLLLIATPFGIILAPPAMTLTEAGYVFSYTLGWGVILPFALFIPIVFSIGLLIADAVKKHGVWTNGVFYIILGSLALAAGNLIQILPGNTFPWDTLSGIVFAGLITVALSRKRMFQLSLLVSRTAVLLAGLVVCVIGLAYFIGPTQTFLLEYYELSLTTATTLIVVIFAVILSLVYVLLRRLLDMIFTREEQQNKLLKTFSASVSQSLSTSDIMKKLIAIITAEVPARRVFVCLPGENGFPAAYSSDELRKKNICISKDSPFIKYLSGAEQYIIVPEFKKDPLYLSVWQSEKDVLAANSIVCIAAMKDGRDIVGLLLLSEKERSVHYSFTEINFIETVCSITSIALKNAGLYEQMYREARIDSLTGVYNYRYFIEELNSQFKKCVGESLSLMYVDMDDFKLYNQLYGSAEGDRILRKTADIITLCVGQNGTVFRSSGKVFAVLLPYYDGRRTEQLAQEILKRVHDINSAPGLSHLKRITASFGICISPYAASTAKELMENADLAAYNAKNSGKDCISFFKGAEPVSQSIFHRAMDIVERGHAQNSAYQTNSATIHALTAAIDAKDHYTCRHSQNVALYSATLAAAAGMTDEQISMVYESGLLHDIGKISIPEAILGKTGSLSGDEYEIMKGHVNSSIDMIRYLPSMDYVIPSAISHHERWDGQGYPRGISGQNIPLSARCLALADAFDAMTTDRPYRKGFSAEYAASQIEQNSGTQFDPQLAAIFVTLVRTGEITLDRK